MRSFFGDEGDGEVTGCVVGAFGIVSDDPSKTLAEFFDLESSITRLVSGTVDIDEKKLGYSQARPRFTLRVHKWIGPASAAAASDAAARRSGRC